MNRDASARMLPVTMLAALAAGGARAQQPPPLDAYRATAQVNVVNVEVFVADRDGKTVTGLTPADFEVLEDGKPQAITNFVDGARTAVDAAGVTAPPATADGARSSATELVSLVLYVDNASLAPAQRDDVLTQVKALLLSGWPGAGVQMMLASGNRAVRVVQPLTADSQLLLEGLEKLVREATGNGAGGVPGFMNRVMENTSTTDSGGSDFAAQDRRAQLESARSAAQEAYERSRSYLAAQSLLIDSLACLPGRKLVVYLSDGFNTRPGEAALQRFDARYGSSAGVGFSAASEATRNSLSNEFRAFQQRANSSRVTFFCVPGSNRPGAGSGADQRYMERDVSIASGETMNQQQALVSMAQATGGTVIPHNGSVGQALVRVLHDVRAAYLLGYANPNPDVGAYHTLKVRVKRNGVVVRHREGYLNKTLDDRMAERALAALLTEGSSNPLDVSVSLRSAAPEKAGIFNAVILAVIPLGNVLLQPKGDVHEGQLSLWVAVRNQEGTITQAAKQVFPLRVPNDRLLLAQGQSVGYTFALRLREGAYQVAVAVRDDIGQIDSTASGSIRIGSGEAAAGK
jgi:VWFA-related protein